MKPTKNRIKLRKMVQFFRSLIKKAIGFTFKTIPLDLNWCAKTNFSTGLYFTWFAVFNLFARAIALVLCFGIGLTSCNCIPMHICFLEKSNWWDAIKYRSISVQNKTTLKLFENVWPVEINKTNSKRCRSRSLWTHISLVDTEKNVKVQMTTGAEKRTRSGRNRKKATERERGAESTILNSRIPSWFFFHWEWELISHT